MVAEIDASDKKKRADAHLAKKRVEQFPDFLHQIASLLTAAKSAAMAMAKGACGDYVVSNPIAHLNGITANLLERE